MTLSRSCKQIGLLLGGSIVALASLLPAAHGQMLARPGWAGSGLTLNSWWIHAVTYEIDPHQFADANGDGKGDLRGLASRLEYIRSLGVDAIALTNFAPEQGDPVARYQTLDPSLGTFDDFDDMVREASRDGMRLVVELDPQQIPDPEAMVVVARFWLRRGIGGIGLRSTQPSQGADQRAVMVRRLHDLAKGFAGQRIVIDEAAPGSAANTLHDGAGLTLHPALAEMTSPLNAAAVRAALQRLQGAPKGDAVLSFTDGPGLARSAVRYGDPATARVLATFLLGVRANAQVYFGQEIGLTTETMMPWGVPVDPTAKKPVKPVTHGPEVVAEEAAEGSLLNWYRRLIDLHHGNDVLRTGSMEFLNHDDQNSVVWVSRKQPITPRAPAIVVACNLSSKPVTLSLTEDMKKLHLRGTFLRTVLRSDQGMGGMDLDAVTLQPFGVYIGELRF